MNYYNEFDKKAAAWLRELIKAGEIPKGFVDERSITDVKPNELSGYTQCHFFAGIGGWSLALKLAAWPSTRSVGTGSCPCQPFSAAGKGLGTADPRHLWPAFCNLIRECRKLGQLWTTTIFGEQVASAAGRIWLSGVRNDLEGMGYAVGAADLCSAGVGSPNIRQRLYWMACTLGERRGERSGQLAEVDCARGVASGRSLSGLADAISERGCGGSARSEDAGHARLAVQDGRERERERERERGRTGAPTGGLLLQAGITRTAAA